jgi:hypothetical protein
MALPPLPRTVPANASNSANATAPAPAAAPPAAVRALLGGRAVFTGRLVEALPPQGALQLVVVRPADAAGRPAADPALRLEPVRAALLTALDLNSPAVDVLCAARGGGAAGGVAGFRAGIDAGFQVRLGRATGEEPARARPHNRSPEAIRDASLSASRPAIGPG